MTDPRPGAAGPPPPPAPPSPPAASQLPGPSFADPPGPLYADAPVAWRGAQATDPIEAGTRAGGRRGIAGLLVAGLRGALLLPVRPGTIPVSAGLCLLLVLSLVALVIAGDRMLLGDEASIFNWQALRATGLDLLLVVLGGAWLAESLPAAARERARADAIGQRRGAAAPREAWREPTLADATATATATAPAAPRTADASMPTAPDHRAALPAATGPTDTPRAAIPLLHFAVVVFAATFWVLLVSYGVSMWLDARSARGEPTMIPGMWFYALVTLWPWLVATRAVQYMNRFQPLSAWRRFVVLVALFATLLWALVDPGEPYWLPEGPPQPADYVQSDEILELQRELTDRQIAALEPQRSGVVDLYFVGFAPYAAEDVFRRELEVIQPLMDQRFDTAGRSLRLVNNAATLRRHPIATIANLERALQAVAARMDREEDVLVMYLTTHGSQDFRLAARFAPLMLAELDPAQLAAMLGRTGIRHRVIIVSACYAGGFVGPLRDEDTLVMTAATVDRPSFGCGHQSDFTWFGKALFDEALRDTYSFEDAFANALPRIAAREREQGFAPSLPQIASGARLRERLRLVERRLAERG